MADNPSVAVVTGASSGIGEAIASRLVRSGFRVFSASLTIAKEPGVESLIVDVTNADSVSACVTDVLARAGRIDVLVNNAGFSIIAALEESSTEQAHSIFETNVFGVMRMTRAVLPTMRSRGIGRIINISSVSGFLPTPFSGLYSATKHALEGYSESLEFEVRPIGIRVSLIQPGFTRSHLGDNMPPPDAPLAVYERGRSSMLRIFSEAQAKADAPETVAEVVLEAATAKNPRLRYTSGQQAPVLFALRRFVPHGLFQLALRKQFKLDWS